MISPPKRKRGESGNSLFLGTAALVYIIPLMGLSIDTSFIYAVKGRLQAAVDGAALGAARALNLGQSLTAQQTNAAQNAVNWFYANFPPNTWATTGTVMSTAGENNSSTAGFGSTGQAVHIYADPNNPQLDHVDVVASTKVPTWFMHWFGINSTTLTTSSYATRRAMVAMMVLDRSGSMCKVGSTQNSPCSFSNTTYPCHDMIQAAKLFTGQFAEGRDYIGMISFAHNAYVHTPPTQSFQTTLGYTAQGISGTGQIDNIVCNGGTNTAQAVSLGYQLLYQTALPGALNVLLLETDGLPNAMTSSFFDPSNNKLLITSTSGCKDTAGKTQSNGGFGASGFAVPSKVPNWTVGLTLNASPFLTTSGAYSNVPAGMIGTIPSSDTSSPGDFWMMDYYFTSSTANNFDTYTTSGSDYLQTANGCGFNATSATSPGYFGTTPPDIALWPTADVYGNKTNPTGAYKTVSTTGGYPNATSWTQYHNSVLNATDNSAYVARTNATIPAYVMAIGLGGNSTTGPVDPILMQRMANDPNGDEFNTTGPDTGGAYYLPCAQETGCVTYPDPQLQGTFVYAPTTAQLGPAFIKIASQILRLNK